MLSNNLFDTFTQGARLKSQATVQFENLIKNILWDNKSFSVNYNSLNEMIVIVNGYTFNLTQLFKHQIDYEQLQFNDEDLKKYDAFLRDPQTTNGHIELEEGLEKENLENMKNIFPHLTVAEMSAIRHYSGGFYAPIYHLIKFNAQQPFPTFKELMDKTKKYSLNGNLIDGDLGGELIAFEVKFNPNHNPDDWDPSNLLYLANVVKEILLHASMAASALSKNLQTEFKLAAVSSVDHLKTNLNKISGLGFALVPDTKEEIHDFVVVPKDKDNGKEKEKEKEKPLFYHVYIIGYQDIAAQLPQVIDLRELLSDVNLHGVQFTSQEVETILNEITSVKDFSLCKNLSSLLQTKFIDVLLSIPNIKEFIYENVFHYEEDVNYFEASVLPEIQKNLNTNESYQFIKPFISTSKVPQDYFTSGNTNILMTLNHPLGFAKNIKAIAHISSERERLFIPGQQIAFTKMETKELVNADNEKEKLISLEGFPVRSIDGLHPFSYFHELILLRENLITLSDLIKKNEFSIGEKATQENILHYLSNINTMIEIGENENNERIDANIFTVNLVKTLINYYLHSLLLNKPNTSLTLFNENNFFADIIKKFVADNFLIILPVNVDEHAAEIHIPVPESFKLKTNYAENDFTFLVDAVRNTNMLLMSLPVESNSTLVESNSICNVM